MNSREFQVLLYCAQSHLDAGRMTDLINQGLNWSTLLEGAELNGVRPMLRRGLKSVCWDAVPHLIQVELERCNRAILLRNLVCTGELLRLLSVFQQNGISIVAFKGPVLAQAVYNDLSLREFVDLDIIVRHTDLCKAEDILADCGYQAQFPDRDYRSTFVAYQGQYAFRQSRTGLWVDLHWHLSSLKTEEIWPKLRQVRIAGRTIPTLANDDLALFLASHGTKEGWARLSWVCDFAQLLRTCENIDWAEVFHRARRVHASRALLLAIVLASTLLNAPGPTELASRARNDPSVQRLAKRAQERMLRPFLRGEVTEFLDNLSTYDKLRHRAWPVAALLMTRTVGDYRAMPLPKSLWGTYYLTRPFRLAGKAAKMFLTPESS
jgi:hypothetical protein